MTRPKNTPGVSVGDRLVVCAHHLGEPERDAEILRRVRRGRAVPCSLGGRRPREHHLPSSDISIEHFPASHTTRRAPAGEGS